jgi:hypothetical protein
MRAGLTITATLIAVAVLYVIECAIWPWAPCPKCVSGRRYAPTGNKFRLCPRCQGTGRRLRIGRRIYNFFRK